MSNKVFTVASSSVKNVVYPNWKYLDINMMSYQSKKTVVAAYVDKFSSQLLQTEKDTDIYPNTNIRLEDSDSVFSYTTKTTLPLYSSNNFNILKLVDINAIRNALDNIFTWIPGQRILLPEFGSNLRKLLYEGITTKNELNIIAEIKYSISKWEPRILIDNIFDASSLQDHENNTICLIVVYTIPSISNELYQYTYTQSISLT